MRAFHDQGRTAMVMSSWVWVRSKGYAAEEESKPIAMVPQSCPAGVPTPPRAARRGPSETQTRDSDSETQTQTETPETET